MPYIISFSPPLTMRFILPSLLSFAASTFMLTLLRFPFIYCHRTVVSFLIHRRYYLWCRCHLCIIYFPFPISLSHPQDSLPSSYFFIVFLHNRWAMHLYTHPKRFPNDLLPSPLATCDTCTNKSGMPSPSTH